MKTQNTEQNGLTIKSPLLTPRHVAKRAMIERKEEQKKKIKEFKDRGIRFVHYRRIGEDGKPLSTGGMTAAIDDISSLAGVAHCSLADNYCRRVGAIIAAERLGSPNAIGARWIEIYMAPGLGLVRWSRKRKDRGFVASVKRWWNRRMNSWLSRCTKGCC